MKMDKDKVREAWEILRDAIHEVEDKEIKTPGSGYTLSNSYTPSNSRKLQDIGAYIDIKQIRKLMGITQKEMGKLMGMSQPAIARIETGVRKETKQQLALLRCLLEKAEDTP